MPNKITPFAKWLTEEVNSRGWNMAEFIRRSGLSSGTTSNILNGDRRPGPVFCRKAAKALGLPPEEVFRKADLLPDASLPDDKKNLRYIHEMVSRMEDEDLDEVINYLKFLVMKKLTGR